MTIRALAVNRLHETSLAQEIQFLLARARAQGNARANELLTEVDLKVRSYSILSLSCSGMNPTQRELGDFLHLDPSQIVALVDELESRGLVKREVDPSDRRSKIISATQDGHALYDRAYSLVMAAEDDALGTLSRRERSQLRSILQKIAF